MSKKVVWIIFIFFILLAAVTVSYYCLVAKYFGYPDGAGTFGDLFGGLNVILTGLVFILTAYSLYRNEKLTLENKKAAIDQANIQEINILITQIDKIHHEFDANKEIANIIYEIQMKISVYTELWFRSISSAEYESMSHPDVYVKEERRRCDEFTAMMPREFPQYVEYVKLIQYTFSLLNNMVNSSAAAAYTTILFTKFSKDEKKLLIFYAMHYEYGVDNQQSFGFLKNLYKFGFLKTEFTEGLVPDLKITDPIDFMVRAKMRMLMRVFSKREQIKR